jgi:hypothetical protein
MNKLQAFENEKDPLERNRLLFSWLCDDQLRRELYEDLQREKFPVLQFKSLLRSKSNGEWTYEDVYFLSKKEDLETALKHYSVAPYQELDSGGKFMLGLDDDSLHGDQRKAAEAAIGIPNSTDKCPRHVASEKSEEREHLFTSKEISECARAAFRRAAVRPLNRAARGFGRTNHEDQPVESVADGRSRRLNSHEFDLTIDVAEEAALHFLKLLFGFRDEAQPVLQRLAIGAYERLVFQIIGRHFVAAADSNIPPLGHIQREQIKAGLRKEIEFAAHSKGDEPFREGAPKESAIKKLDRYPGLDREMLEVIVAGLIAGTVGNVRAAVPIVIYDFFNRKDDKGKPLIDTAREAALAGDEQKLEDLITNALRRNPPAAFLTRSSKPISKNAPALWFKDERNVRRPIPEGAHLLLAMGADPAWKFVFGGDHSFKHNCVGKHLAWPLIVEVVRQVLQLPGLAQIIEPDSGKPRALVKRWGVICELYELFYQRDRRLNQQPLYVVLPIKEPVKENANILWKLTQSGAHIVEAALKESGIVHFAWFMLVENGTHLALSTVFDGDFDAYVEHFAVKVPLFDKQFEFLDVEQRTPIRQHAKQFVENIRKYNRAPLAEYFFSAYPTMAVADVINATSDTAHPSVTVADAVSATASETAHSAVAKILGVTSDKASGAVTPAPFSAATSDSL